MKRKVDEMSKTSVVENIQSFDSEPNAVSSVVENIQSCDSEPDVVYVEDAQDAVPLSQDNLEGKFSDG